MSIIGSHWYRYPRIIVLWHPSIREPVYSCGTMIDLDLTVKRRDPNAPIRIALDDVRCPRCNSYGRTGDGATAFVRRLEALIACGRAAPVTPPVSPVSVRGPFSPL
jgi:hypothetical protein